MVFMVLAGVVSVLFGVAYLAAPQVVNRWSQLANKPLPPLDGLLQQFRVGVGLTMLAVGLFCLASAYYVQLLR